MRSVRRKKAEEIDTDVDPSCSYYVGSMSTLTERPKGRKKKYRRPIGFLADIDTLVPCDD
jgi:hypothetical protein